jgi:hypothetical protein
MVVLKVLAVMASVVASLLLGGFIPWAITYFLIDGSEPENPGTDLGAGLAFLGLFLLFAPLSAAVGGFLATKLLFRRDRSS